jgi:hypothetical protein
MMRLINPDGPINQHQPDPVLAEKPAATNLTTAFVSIVTGLALTV